MGNAHFLCQRGWFDLPLAGQLGTLMLPADLRTGSWPRMFNPRPPLAKGFAGSAQAGMLDVRSAAQLRRAIRGALPTALLI